MMLVAALATVVLPNQATREVPGIILLFFTSAAGFIAVITVALLLKRIAKSQD